MLTGIDKLQQGLDTNIFSVENLPTPSLLGFKEILWEL